MELLKALRQKIKSEGLFHAKEEFEVKEPAGDEGRSKELGCEVGCEELCAALGVVDGESDEGVNDNAHDGADELAGGRALNICCGLFFTEAHD